MRGGIRAKEGDGALESTSGPFPYGAYIYRWGLGRSIQPGETVTIDGYIRLITPQVQDYWVGIVQEAMGWYNEGTGRTTITVLPGAPTHKVFLPMLLRAHVAPTAVVDRFEGTQLDAHWTSAGRLVGSESNP